MRAAVVFGALAVAGAILASRWEQLRAALTDLVGDMPAPDSAPPPPEGSGLEPVAPPGL